MVNIFQIGLCGSMIISLSANAAARSTLEHLSALKEGVSSEHVEELKLAPDMAVQVLVQCDSNSNIKVRRNCVRIAARIALPDLVDPLKPYLKDPDSNVRREAIQALSNIAGDKAIPWIMPLSNDADALTRVSALSNLAELGGRDVLDVFKSKLKDPDPYVKLAAGNLLAYYDEFVSPEVARTLINSSSLPPSDSKGIRVKGAALRLLGLTGDKSDLPIFDAIIDREIDYNKADAYQGRQQLRVKLAANEEVRRRILEESFLEGRVRRWAAWELVRRYRLGDKSMMKIAEDIMADKSHVGRSEADGAYEKMNAAH